VGEEERKRGRKSEVSREEERQREGRTRGVGCNLIDLMQGPPPNPPTNGEAEDPS
jgi:hypothetical protein